MTVFRILWIIIKHVIKINVTFSTAPSRPSSGTSAARRASAGQPRLPHSGPHSAYSRCGESPDSQRAPPRGRNAGAAHLRHLRGACVRAHRRLAPGRGQTSARETAWGTKEHAHQRGGAGRARERVGHAAQPLTSVACWWDRQRSRSATAGRGRGHFLGLTPKPRLWRLGTEQPRGHRKEVESPPMLSQVS